MVEPKSQGKGVDAGRSEGLSRGEGRSFYTVQ